MGRRAALQQPPKNLIYKEAKLGISPTSGLADLAKLHRHSRRHLRAVTKTAATFSNARFSRSGSRALHVREVPFPGEARSSSGTSELQGALVTDSYGRNPPELARSRFTDFEMSTVKFKLASFLLHRRN